MIPKSQIVRKKSNQLARIFSKSKKKNKKLKKNVFDTRGYI